MVYCFWHVVGRIGLSIDLQWHIDVGRDQMFTPPHMMILVGLFPAMFLSLLFLIWSTRDYHKGIAVNGLKIGPFVAPIAIWMTFLGQITIILGGLYDDYWHAQYGIDVNITTPPHLWTIFGGVVAELATIVLACQLIFLSNKEGNKENQLITTIALLAIWAIVIHLYFTAGNFLDSREAVVELAGLQILPHLALAGFITILLIELTTHLFGQKEMIKLSMIILTSQFLLLFLIPVFVDMLMGSEHVYRPGSPHQVLVPNFMPWLLLPVLICFRKWPLLKNNKLIYILIILSIDPIWLPVHSQYLPSMVGDLELVLSILISIPIMYLAISSSKKVAIILDNLALIVINKKQTQQNKSKRKTQSLGVIAVFLLLISIMLVPMAQGHGGVHKTEQGDGFDAPMRMLFDIENTEFWVEFMIFPPKALGSTEILVYPVDETANVSEIWIETVFIDERGETRVVTQLEKLPGRDLWAGTVKFSFSGNNTIEFWANIDATESYTAIDVEVDGPASLTVTMAWILGLGWPFTMGILLWGVGRHNAANFESEEE
ncbi:MAG: hypothetical protein ACKVHN_01600 [Candidatus Poseidoniales archaeon]|tara:strand:- start:309 stop:1943 length:1635 start_codon:yes stop_codon:yes gene_type:complete